MRFGCSTLYLGMLARVSQAVLLDVIRLLIGPVLLHRLVARIALLRGLRRRVQLSGQESTLVSDYWFIGLPAIAGLLGITGDCWLSGLPVIGWGKLGC